MKKAIVSGSNGLVGQEVVRHLLQNNISVVALGRRSIEQSPLCNLAENSLFEYLTIENEYIDDLQGMLEQIGWNVGNDCVFYNFSWEGQNSLTDGSFESQLKNIEISTAMVAVASSIGCIKYISVGSQEEIYMERFLRDEWQKTPYHSPQDKYAVAKICCRDQTQLAAYLHQISFIHTRFSAVVSPDLKGSGYIHSTLRKIKAGDEFEEPINGNLYDFISIGELARAFYLVGQFGKNKSNYYIGSGRPMTLKNFFSRFTDYSSTKPTLLGSYSFLTDYDMSVLTKDTGFEPRQKFKDLVKEIMER